MYRGLCVTGLVITALVGIRAGDKSSLFAIFIVGAFGVWAILPYVALLRSERRGGARVVRGVSLSTAALVVVFGVSAYLDEFVLRQRPDAEAGLLFIFVPMCQWLLIGIGSIVGRVVERRVASGR